MSRRRYVVCYDVREPKRLRRTHKALLGYGDPLQYSVFVCDLSEAERALMEEAIRRVVDLTEDSVAVIDLGPADGSGRHKIRQLGQKRMVERDRCVVV